MANVIDFNGPDLELNPSAGNDITVSISPNANGAIHSPVIPPSDMHGGILTINGNNNGTVSIDTGLVAYAQTVINNLSTSSFVLARSAPLTVNGISSTQQTTVYADSQSAATPYANVQASLKNTLLVANGNNTPQTMNIYDRGGNSIWAGDQKLTVHLSDYDSNSSDSNKSTVYGGKDSGNFKFEGDKGTPNHLDVVLNAVNHADPSSNPSYVIDADEHGSFSIYQSAGTLNFNGYNSTIALNGDLNGDPNKANAFLTLRGNDNVWTGKGDTHVNLVSGDNRIFNSGEGNIFITGSPNGYASHLWLSDSGQGSGVTTYDQSWEDVTIDGLKGVLNTSLGQGRADINVSTLNGYDITMGLGDTIIRGYSISAGLNPDVTNHNFHLLDGQGITSASYTGGNTVYQLSGGNTVTFTGVDLTNNDPFNVAPTNNGALVSA